MKQLLIAGFCDLEIFAAENWIKLIE